MRMDGEISSLAGRLSNLLAGFEKAAGFAAAHVPALAGYPQFVGVLDFLSGATCTGCRQGGMPLPFCAARTCAPRKGVSFCFQCGEYPCSRNSFPSHLAASWRRCNDRMKDIGVEAFYDEQLGTARYQSQED